MQGPFPPEYSFNRKEQLVKLAAEYFSQAKLWEKANNLIEDLLIHTQKRKASMASESVIKRVLLKTTYFEPRLKKKQSSMIFRGSELEKLSDFVRKIKVRYSDAELVFESNQAKKPNAKWIQITSCKPSSEAVMNSADPKNISVRRRMK